MLPIFSENKAKDTLRTILRQNKRLSYLVADLLTLCRIDQDTSSRGSVDVRGELNTSHQIKKTKIALPNLIIEVEEELAALAMASEIELSSQIKVFQPIKVIGDRQQLYRLIINLVTNAIQYTPAGGQVILSLFEEHHDAVICVRDTGIGIALQEQKRIFDRFYRVDQARSRSKGGAGLGLAIAQAIALAHNGSLEVQSEVEKGSSFTVRLPKCN
jgi:signal transduction histidine kinase